MIEETLLLKTLFEQNLGQPRGLMVENSNIYKRMRKKTTEEYIIRYSYIDFLKHKILKVKKKHTHVDEQ